MKTTENLVQISGAIVFKSASPNFLRVTVVTSYKEKKSTIDVYFFGELANQYDKEFQTKDQVHIEGAIQTRREKVQTVVGSVMTKKKNRFGKHLTDKVSGRMEDDENTVFILGELVRVKETANGRFVVATIRTMAGERTCFVKIQLYGKVKERIMSMKEGDTVAVGGFISSKIIKTGEKTEKKEFLIGYSLGSAKE